MHAQPRSTCAAETVPAAEITWIDSGPFRRHRTPAPLVPRPYPLPYPRVAFIAANDAPPPARPLLCIVCHRNPAQQVVSSTRHGRRRARWLCHPCIAEIECEMGKGVLAQFRDRVVWHFAQRARVHGR